jgi:hypothetical protein
MVIMAAGGWELAGLPGLASRLSGLDRQFGTGGCTWRG